MRAMHAPPRRAVVSLRRRRLDAGRKSLGIPPHQHKSSNNLYDCLIMLLTVSTTFGNVSLMVDTESTASLGATLNHAARCRSESRNVFSTTLDSRFYPCP